MSLCELIGRAENDSLTDADLEHPLLMDVLDEIAECEKEENAWLKRLFGDAKLLSDNVLQQYFKLNGKERRELSAVYESEDCFRILGAVNGCRQRLKKLIGEKKYTQLSQISNYSKLIPIIEHYIKVNKYDANFTVERLHHFFATRTFKGRKVSYNSPKSMARLGFLDFRKGRTNELLREKQLIRSVMYGLPESLQERFRKAIYRYDLRKNILEDYVAQIDGLEKADIRTKNLTDFLIKNGHINFLTFNFKRLESKLKKERWGLDDVIDSLSHDMPIKLRRAVAKSHSLYHQREHIIRNYIRHLNSKDITPKQLSLRCYLSSHNFNGDEVEFESPESLMKYGRHDFEVNGRLGKEKEEGIIRSMTHGLPKSLIVEMRRAKTLFKQRKRILKNYIKHAGTIILSSQKSLAHYLRSHNAYGERVANIADSLHTYTTYDFERQRYMRSATRELTVQRMIFLMPMDIIEAVDEAEALLPQRRRIVRNFVAYVNDNLDLLPSERTMAYYLERQDLDGYITERFAKNSLNSFRHFDFTKIRSYKNLPVLKVFESTTHGLDDDLIEEARDAESLLPQRVTALRNYVKFRRNSSASLETYLGYHTIEGERIRWGKSGSLIHIGMYNWAKGRSDRKIRLENMLYRVKDKRLIAAVRRLE